MTINSLVFMAKRALSKKKRLRSAGFSIFELCMRNISRLTLLQYLRVIENNTKLIRNSTPTGPEKNTKLADAKVSSINTKKQRK